METLLLAYEFEGQGFSLDRGAYLPDFYLTKQGIWLEVKGPPPSFEEEDLCQCLAVETRQPAIIAWGQPSWEGVVICFTPDGGFGEHPHQGHQRGTVGKMGAWRDTRHSQTQCSQ